MSSFGTPLQYAPYLGHAISSPHASYLAGSHCPHSKLKGLRHRRSATCPRPQPESAPSAVRLPSWASSPSVFGAALLAVLSAEIKPVYSNPTVESRHICVKQRFKGLLEQRTEAWGGEEWSCKAFPKSYCHEEQDWTLVSKPLSRELSRLCACRAWLPGTPSNVPAGSLLCSHSPVGWFQNHQLRSPVKQKLLRSQAPLAVCACVVFCFST